MSNHSSLKIRHLVGRAYPRAVRFGKVTLVGRLGEATRPSGSRVRSSHRKSQKYNITHSPIAFPCRACLTRQVNVNLGIWSKLTKVVVVLIVTAFLLLIGMCYLKPIQQNERMRADILRLQIQQQKEEEISRQLKAEIDALRNDPQTLERLTREKLGYARPDETVIRFKPATNTPTTR